MFDTPGLISSLAEYSEQRVSRKAQDERSEGSNGLTKEQGSILFLRVQAAADFFATNKTLMHHPPPVSVDIILDPYLGNIFPQSLVPTGAYIVLLAIGGWLVSGVIWRRFCSDPKTHTD